MVLSRHKNSEFGAGEADRDDEQDGATAEVATAGRGRCHFEYCCSYKISANSRRGSLGEVPFLRGFDGKTGEC